MNLKLNRGLNRGEIGDGVGSGIHTVAAVLARPETKIF